MNRHPSMLSIFDFDRTLSRHGSWSPFLVFAAKKRAPWRLALAPFLLAAMMGYRLKLLSRKSLKELMHLTILGDELPPEAVTNLTEAFAGHFVESNILPQALTQLRDAQGAGHMVIIASASHEFYLRPIAARLGVTHVIGTRSKYQGSALLSSISGDNCYGDAKLERVQRYLADQQIDRSSCHIRFYSDDISDLPCLLWSDEPIAVNPSKRLAHYAAGKGWNILNWRSGLIDGHPAG